MKTFKPGDVIRYTSATDHCREGLAIVEEAGIAFDTFWVGRGNDRLSLAELETAEVWFNWKTVRIVDLADWEMYLPEHRYRITHQHGIKATYYVQSDAQPSDIQHVRVLRRRAAEATSAARLAQARLHTAETRYREALAELIPGWYGSELTVDQAIAAVSVAADEGLVKEFDGTKTGHQISLHTAIAIISGSGSRRWDRNWAGYDLRVFNGRAYRFEAQPVDERGL